MLLGMGAVMGYGWYKLIGGIREAKYVLILNYLNRRLHNSRKGLRAKN